MPEKFKFKLNKEKVMGTNEDYDTVFHATPKDTGEYDVTWHYGRGAGTKVSYFKRTVNHNLKNNIWIVID